MYLYETHCHTSPVSACARANVFETLDFYKSRGYDGVFITNHFIDSNIGMDKSESYETKIRFFFHDYEQAVLYGEKIGIKVFDGVEFSHQGTDFLVYGLHKDWYLAHPEIMDMPIVDRLAFLREHGGYVVHAHPFREAGYIDYIRLLPRSIDAVEGINANRTAHENRMAQVYAQEYGFPVTAGSDNHVAHRQKWLAGMFSDKLIDTVEDFIAGMKNRQFSIFEQGVIENEK